MAGSASIVSTPQAPRSDIPVLHGIRGLLALWVLLGHTLDSCGAYLPVLSAPGVAVYAFMVMSGLLMDLHYRLRETREPWSSPRTWWVFYIRRFFRIAPLYYLALLIAFVFHTRYLTDFRALEAKFPLWFINASAPIQTFDFKSLLLHATFLFGLLPSQADNNILPDWSIGLEMQFYLVFPFLMLVLRNVRHLWFALAAAIIVLAAQKYGAAFPQPSFLPVVLTIFVCGMFMSEAWLVADASSSALYLVLAIFLASVKAPFMFQAIPLIFMLLINFPRLAPAMKASVIISRSESLLGGRLGLFLGDRSYSVYLIHMLVLVPLVTWLARFGWFTHLQPLARFAAAAPLALIISYGLASITLVTIENPMIALGHRLARRWRTPELATN